MNERAFIAGIMVKDSYRSTVVKILSKVGTKALQKHRINWVWLFHVVQLIVVCA